MIRDLIRTHLRAPKSRREIVQEFCRGKSVLDIGCVHHALENVDAEGWLHKSIVEVAREVVGVDFLADEIAALSARGFNVVAGDVNRPLPLERQFDVIVVGNLIEHLSSFDGLFENLARLLAPGGVVLISTANPFYREQYFFSALKNDIHVNPEHTCWIDPVTLDQLGRRFRMKTVEVRWVRERWPLSSAIFDGACRSLDNRTGVWTFNCAPGPVERVCARVLDAAFRLPLDPARQERVRRRYGPDVGRFLYMRMLGVAVDAWWRVRRVLIPTSDINRHELYFSVLVADR